MGLDALSESNLMGVVFVNVSRIHDINLDSSLMTRRRLGD